MIDPIRTRPATENDKTFIKALNKEAYEEVVVRQFGGWDEALQDRRFEEKWAIQQYQIVEQADEKIGALWIKEEPDHLWLCEIQICRSHQNRGIGTGLLNNSLDQAITLGLPLRLRVLKKNRAKSLYERLGFKVIGMFEDTHFWMEHTG